MTKENAKALYKHYKDTGQEENAEELLEKYPDLEEEEEFECEECGDKFDSERGLKVHKSQKHKEEE